MLPALPENNIKSKTSFSLSNIVALIILFILGLIIIPRLAESYKFSSRELPDNSIPAEVIKDKIPLVDAVKRDCLIKNITFTGEAPEIAPFNRPSVEDIFLRTLLVECRIRGKSETATPASNVIVEFKTYLEPKDVKNEINFENDKLFFGNPSLSIKITSNNIVLFENATLGNLRGLDEGPERFNISSLISSAASRLSGSLSGLGSLSSPKRTFLKACAMRPIKRPSDIYKLTTFAGLPNPVEINILTNGWAKRSNDEMNKNGKNNYQVRLSESYGPANYGFLGGTKPKIVAYSFDSDKNSDFLIWGVVNYQWEIDELKGQIYPGLKASDKYYNCQTSQDINRINAIRNFDGISNLSMEKYPDCVSPNIPVIYSIENSGIDNCENHGGQCGLSINSDVIISGNDTYSITGLGVSGRGIGITDYVNRNCYNRLSVAE